jgi:hypothetical protein
LLELLERRVDADGDLDLCTSGAQELMAGPLRGAQPAACSLEFEEVRFPAMDQV